MGEPVKPLFKVKVPGMSALPPGLNRPRQRAHVRRSFVGLSPLARVLAFNFDFSLVLVAASFVAAFWSAGHPAESVQDIYLDGGILAGVFFVYFVVFRFLFGATPMKIIFNINFFLGVIVGCVLTYFLSPVLLTQLKTVARNSAPSTAAAAFLRQIRAPQLTAETQPVFVLFSEDRTKVIFWNGWRAAPFAVPMIKRGNAWIYAGRAGDGQQ